MWLKSRGGLGGEGEDKDKANWCMSMSGGGIWRKGTLLGRRAIGSEESCSGRIGLEKLCAEAGGDLGDTFVGIRLVSCEADTCWIREGWVLVIESSDC